MHACICACMHAFGSFIINNTISREKFFPPGMGESIATHALTFLRGFEHVCFFFSAVQPNLFRRRKHVCLVWDYHYTGTGKGPSQPWNSKYINFVPFLCSITRDVLLVLREVCKMDQNRTLLFQKDLDDIKAVCCFKSLHFQYAGQE